MSILFSSIKVNGVGFPNRVVMPPMVTGTGDARGRVTPSTLDHYRPRAQAGTGMIIVEATYVDAGGRCWNGGLGAADTAQTQGLAGLAGAIKGGGAVAAIQLVHGGPQASAEVSGMPTVGPSAVRPAEGVPIPRELLVAEIRAIENRFADAAGRCIEGGFDAVEIHGAHGFLLDSFLSADRNRRTDEYGGDIAGRMRMLVETCEAVRARIGNRGLLICRISIFNKLAEGFTHAELVQLVRGLEAAGVDILHVSTDGAFKPYFGGGRTIGQLTKALSRLPVIVAGGLGDPADAERAAAEGHCDFAAVGNAMMEDAEWTRRARGKIETAQ